MHKNLLLFSVSFTFILLKLRTTLWNCWEIVCNVPDQDYFVFCSLDGTNMFGLYRLLYKIVFIWMSDPIYYRNNQNISLIFRILIQMESQNLLKHQRSLWCRTWDFPKRYGRQSRLQIQELHYGKLAKLLAKLGKKWPKKKDKNMYEFITFFHESWISICSCFGGFFPRKKVFSRKISYFGILWSILIHKWKSI